MTNEAKLLEEIRTLKHQVSILEPTLELVESVNKKLGDELYAMHEYHWNLGIKERPDLCWYCKRREC